MSAIVSKIKTDSPEFQKNDAANRALADELHAIHDRLSQGGSERARKKHLARGKLLPRDRVRKLVDPGSPFLEIGQLAAYGQYDNDLVPIRMD